MVNAYEEKVRIFKALCDENRLRILEILQSGEKCACKLLDDLNIQQSTLSHHMKILCDAGIVQGRRDGKWTHYSIDLEGSKHVQEVLRQLLQVSCDEQEWCCRE